jgi:RHS repeat-associated protein
LWSSTNEEGEKQYYYHGDHLGSAQLISDVRGEEYERIEYTPYGEVWIENKGAVTNLDISYRFTGKERDAETGLYYYGARYLDSKTGRWLSTDPALGEYLPGAPINDEARKRNGNLPGMGGVFNLVNLHVYHYSANNPVKYTDPDGRSPKSALKLISQYREDINRTARVFHVDPAGIASVIFQEKYHGIFAELKNVAAFVHDGGVNDNTPSTRSYGLAEMQLGLAAELLAMDINESGTKEKVFNLLSNDRWSIALIGANIAKNEEALGSKLPGIFAGYLHNMGPEGYIRYLNKNEPPDDRVAKRSMDYQAAINDALNGTIDVRKDSER